MYRTIIRTLVVAAVMVFSITLYLGIQLYFGNQHEVIPDELYRSAQLEPGDLAYYTKEDRIKTVLNLRGPNAGNAWYDDEVKEADALGLTHIDFAMKASRELSFEQAQALIDIMQKAPKPLLIHCRAGADRTGLAAAIYVAGIAQKGEWAAERQMWLYYGHVPLGASYAMNRTFERLEPIFGFKNS